MSKSGKRAKTSPRSTKEVQHSTPAAPRGLTLDTLANVLTKIVTMDAFSNPLARLGYGTPNIIEGTQYPLTRLTQNYQLLNSLYRNNWIVRRVVDIIPEDMCRNWIAIQSQMPPEAIDKLNRMWRSKRLKQKILQGLKWGRLYGGAAGLIMIEGHEDILDQPLDYDMIMPGSFKNLMIVDRWTGAYPSEELEEDINDVEFGLPKYYEITLENGQVIRVHHSRVLRFTGRDLPYWEKLAEVYWGISEVEIVYEELRKRDNTSFNIASLVFLANLRVLKMEDLGELLALADENAKKDLYNVLQAQNWLMSNMGVYVMSAKDSMETHQYTFAGLNEIYESFMMDIAGACQIPVTRLFGRSPAGMDATGESDLQHYYETVQQAQETYLAPILDKLLPIMCMSEFGAIPDDLDYSFNPIRNPTDKDIADLVQQKSAAIVNLFNAGIISQKTALQELRQMSDTTGMFTNITDADIQADEDQTTDAGEMIPDGAFASIGVAAPDRVGISPGHQTGDGKAGRFAQWLRRSLRDR
ncbi:DUF1073 domain-containing protein [Alicyclobacillus macrosporangiidus]|uniref:Anti-CBASS protein Acb1-like N-terminal domain-containing protein n=1 Tax=Alicyclobacillus macrosporangiidus TaxID=392015 RepID=A0A1I7IDI0_9BACL|nr:DUF1073 domain-containing protein [Alicyclobacillus macrosporangiidus]SFU70916.1 hypothetical protein SAMN05421543_106151 [Alicyclobacillus macrosporangiidus]